MFNPEDLPSRVLIVENDKQVRFFLINTLELAGYEVLSESTAIEALQTLNNHSFDLVLCDLRLANMDGLTFLKKSREHWPDLPVIMMSGFGNTDIVIESIRQGAADFLIKPFAPEDLILALKKTEQRLKTKTTSEFSIPTNLTSSDLVNFDSSSIVAVSPKMEEIFETIRKIGPFNTTILITGESGTGKELIAKAIHQNSRRRSEPFVAINCAAIPENLIESELFGHKKGAFTDATRDKRGLFMEADGGTVFLDEIGDLPQHLQVKLLRVLQEQRIRRVGDEQDIGIDVRIMAATLKDLEKEVAAGRFRDDLYYRLNVLSIHVPPLRERKEDIRVLVNHFLQKHAKRLRFESPGISQAALDQLHNFEWRGNVRELENCIERSLVLSTAGFIDLDLLPRNIAPRAELREDQAPRPFVLDASSVDESELSIKRHSKHLEINLIRRALDKTRGNRTRASKLLEISHRALLYKLKEYKIS